MVGTLLRSSLAALLALSWIGAAVADDTPAPASAPAKPAASDTVTVFAAISLKDALDKIGAGYTAKTGQKVVFSYGASGALAKQIENGAPADVFASADLKWMDYLAEKKLVDPATRVNLLGNALVLVAPADAPASDLKLEPGLKLAEAIGDSKLAIGNPASVPAGSYAEASLKKLGAWDALQGKLALTENVRGALTFVARGEAKYGIVYKTDALAEPKVKIVGTFPADSHAPIVYPLAIVTGRRSESADAFFAQLVTPQSRQIFEAAGFNSLWDGNTFLRFGASKKF